MSDNKFLVELRELAEAQAAERGMTVAEHIDGLDRALGYKAKEYFDVIRNICEVSCNE